MGSQISKKIEKKAEKIIKEEMNKMKAELQSQSDRNLAWMETCLERSIERIAKENEAEVKKLKEESEISHQQMQEFLEKSLKQMVEKTMEKAEQERRRDLLGMHKMIADLGTSVLQNRQAVKEMNEEQQLQRQHNYQAISALVKSTAENTKVLQQQQRQQQQDRKEAREERKRTDSMFKALAAMNEGQERQIQEERNEARIQREHIDGILVQLMQNQMNLNNIVKRHKQRN